MADKLFQIKSRFSGRVLFELKCASFKLCVEAAVSAGANLSEADLYRANLYGANLSGANGKKITIKKTPVQISGLRWRIIIFDKDMRIGCEYHSLADWWPYDDDRITDMDSHALDFWKQHKGLLQGVCVATGRDLAGEVSRG